MFRFTIRDVLWLTVVVAVVLGAYFIRPRQSRWEYKTIYNASDVQLNAEGNNGWELVSAEQMANGRIANKLKRRK